MCSGGLYADLHVLGIKKLGVMLQSSTQKGLYTHSQTLSFQAQNSTSIESDSIYMNAQENIIHTTSNQILHQVGDTQIITKGDSVIIKAGGVEVVIDSNGLVVKGGEVKSE